MDAEWPTREFEAHRNRLQSLARKMLGSPEEANDALQEAWLRLNRSDPSDIANLGGWLTTVVARICLDMLRARKSHSEIPLDTDADDVGDAGEHSTGEVGQEADLQLADSMGPALMVVLDLLAPGERIAFVLHDIFAVPFEEIAGILGRSPAAARQLASRARRRVQGRETASPETDRGENRKVVDAFLTASRNGDFQALLAILHPEVVLRADETSVQAAAATKWLGTQGLTPELRGARAVGETFKGRARGAQRAVIDGKPGAVWVQGGVLRTAFVFAVSDGLITGIDLVMDSERIGGMGVEMLAELV
jgi:RNA polymerase sigma-70 factor (ECF subfamily)